MLGKDPVESAAQPVCQRQERRRRKARGCSRRRRLGNSTIMPSSGRRIASAGMSTANSSREATDPAKLPSHASKIYLSLWGSDTLKSWMGAFADPGAPVAAEIDRVAFTALGEACQFPESVVCKLK